MNATWVTRFDLQSLIEQAQLLGISVFFDMWVGEDDRDITKNILQVSHMTHHMMHHMTGHTTHDDAHNLSFDIN